MIPYRLHIEPGAIIQSYSVERKIGEGGFGTVYKVSDIHDKKVFALKLLRLWEIDRPVREKIIKRFELEYKTGMIKSPHLVNNHDYGSMDGNPFIVMDYCPRGDLRNQMDKSRINNSTVKKIALQILKGLQSLHSNGKVHRDLKPENILFDENNTARLTDFGIAADANVKVRLTVNDWKGVPKEIFGTYMYMSPEQARPRNAKVTILPSVDIFAFGVLTFELFTGKLPFGKLENHSDLVTYSTNAASGNFSDIRKLNPMVPSAWAAMISECLHPDYRSRPKDVSSIIESLDSENQTPNDLIMPAFAQNIKLQVKQGEDFGDIFNLDELLNHEPFGIITLGRKDSSVVNLINLSDEINGFISRKHATIERIDKEPWWFIRDGQWDHDHRQWKPSLNGTYLNSERVDSIHGLPLRKDDIIILGDTTLKVQ